MPCAEDPDLPDADWAEQVGDVIDEEDVAHLLGQPISEIRRMPALLCVRHPDGRVVYPLMQFDGPRLVPGVDVVVAVFVPLPPLTVAAWLTMRNNELGGHRPIDELRSGGLASVLAVAGRTADRWRH